MPKSQGHASDSTEHHQAEESVRKSLNKKREYPLRKQIVEVGDSTIEVDGIDHQGKTLCEIYCHIGSLKPGQFRKVAADMLKLLVAEKKYGDEWRKVIYLVDPLAASSVKNSWLGAAANQLGVEVEVVTLLDPERDALLEAQRRQRR
jgi:flagellar biosynthesis/type III secretory pathway ATPase